MAERATLRPALLFLTQRLRATGLRVAEVRLFGSHAEGTARPDSDLDVAIISPDFEGRDLFERAALTREAEVRTIQRYQVPLDVLRLTPEELSCGTAPAAAFARQGRTPETLP